MIKIIFFLWWISCSIAMAQQQLLNDYKGAVAEAQKTKKNLLLINFSATWCPACLKLEHDVLQTEEFQKNFKDFVILKIDYDWVESKEWREKYNIKDMPTLVITDLKGQEIERIHGFTTQKDFLDRLQVFQKSGSSPLIQLEKKAKAGDRSAKDKIGLNAYNSQDYKKAMTYLSKTEIYKEEFLLAKINFLKSEKTINKKMLMADLEKYISDFPITVDTPFVRSDLLGLYEETQEKQKFEKSLKEMIQQIDNFVVAKELPNSGRSKNSARDEAIIEKSELYALQAQSQKYFTFLDPKNKNAHSTNEIRAWGNAVDEARKEIRSSKDFGRRITLASYLGKAGRADEADRELWQLQKENPKEYHYPFRRASIAFKAKNYIHAEAQAKEAFNLSKGTHRIYSSALLVEILESIGKDKEAQVFALNGLKSAPEKLNPEKDAHLISKIEFLKQRAD